VIPKLDCGSINGITARKFDVQVSLGKNNSIDKFIEKLIWKIFETFGTDYIPEGARVSRVIDDLPKVFMVIAGAFHMNATLMRITAVAKITLI
jgi:hypothetical protein